MRRRSSVESGLLEEVSVYGIPGGQELNARHRETLPD